GEPPRPSQPAQSLRLRIRDQIQAIPAWGWRLGAAAICAGGIAIGIVASLSPHSSGRPTVETTSGNVTVAPAGNVTEIVMPKIAETPGPAKWWLWGIPGGMILLMGGLLVRGLRQPVVERSYLREARDSEEFRQAIDRCTDLLPSNPRDLVRTINLMRMEYLLQSSQQAPFSGKPLTEWECVSYTLLQQRHPQVFDP